VWNQKFGCLQHARHTPVPLHNSQSAMALLHGYPLGLFDHPKWTSQVRDEQAFGGAYRMPQSGEQVTGSRPFLRKSALARRTLQYAPPAASQVIRTWPAHPTVVRNTSTQEMRPVKLFTLLIYIFFLFSEDRKVAVKNYAVHQSLEDPGSASQQSECNDPAPH